MVGRWKKNLLPEWGHRQQDNHISIRRATELNKKSTNAWQHRVCTFQLFINKSSSTLVAVLKDKLQISHTPFDNHQRQIYLWLFVAENGASYAVCFYLFLFLPKNAQVQKGQSWAGIGETSAIYTHNPRKKTQKTQSRDASTLSSPSRFTSQSSGFLTCYSVCAPSCPRPSIVKHQITSEKFKLHVTQSAL